MPTPSHLTCVTLNGQPKLPPRISHTTLTQSPGLGTTSTTNLQSRRIQHRRNLISNIPSLCAQNGLCERFSARAESSHDNLKLLNIVHHAPLLHRLERESSELVRSIVTAAPSLLETNVSRRQRQQHIHHLLLIRSASIRGRNPAGSSLRGGFGRLHERQVGVVLGGQDVQAVRFDLAGGVEVVAGGIVEEARGAVEDVGEGGAFLLSAALTAGVGVADVLQAADGAVDGLDGGGGEGAFAGGGGFEAQTAGLAD